MKLYIDIETIPSQSPGSLADLWESKIKPPGNITKPETLAAWRKEKAPQLLEEAYHRTSLDSALGEIWCIGFAIDDDEPRVFQRDLWGSDLQDIDGERRLLEDFADAIPEHRAPQIIGFNHIAFDLPFIAHRAAICRVSMPRYIRASIQIPPWKAAGDLYFDTMVAWAGPRGSISLDKLSRILGLEGKGNGPTGADVWPMIQAGRYDNVATYCAADVERTRAIYQVLARYL